MKRRGLTNSALGRALDRSHVMVGNWRRGADRPHPANLLALAEYFGVSVDVLADDDADLPDAQAAVSDTAAAYGATGDARLHAALAEVRAGLEALLARVDDLAREAGAPGADLVRRGQIIREAAQRRVDAAAPDPARGRTTGRG